MAILRLEFFPEEKKKALNQVQSTGADKKN